MESNNMEKPIHILNTQHITLHEHYGTVITEGDKRYLFLPSWIELGNCDHETYGVADFHEAKLHKMDDLPIRLENLLNDMGCNKDGTKKVSKTMGVIMGVDWDMLNAKGSWCIMEEFKFIASGEIDDCKTRTQFQCKIKAIASAFDVDKIIKEN